MKNVLVVDDSPTMRRMIITSLRNLQDAQFQEAGSGLEAIEQMAIQRIDLMILDLNMPDMHGVEVVKFVRRHQIYQHIPIIILTTKSEASSRTQALAAGASLFLTKPFEPHLLAAHTREQLSAKAIP